MNTKFASPERLSSEEVAVQRNILFTHKILMTLFDSVASIGAVLNSHRQIIFANTEFLQFLGIKAIEEVLGKRPGETVGCIHADEEEGRCGTSESCRYCGAIRAVLECQKTGSRVQKESRISAHKKGKLVSLDLLITACPVSQDSNQFIILTLQDISSKIRRMNMERIFFHDLLNSAGGINGALKYLKELEDKNQGKDLLNLAERNSDDLLDEINNYRQISNAENDELVIENEDYNTFDLVRAVLRKILYHSVSERRQIIFDEGSFNGFVTTDYQLLIRILINMLKNALEATSEEGIVTIGVLRLAGGQIRFWTRNNNVIPRDIQLQIFQRSFSTKGRDRGLGTYSMKLLGEQYLKGKVGFESSEKDGTVFFIDLPASQV